MKLEFWYGTIQTFGNQGRPQRCINVLGRLMEPSALRALSCSLNGGPARPLRVGPDRRRLASPGDFNAEIELHELAAGENVLTFHALDHQGAEIAESVTLHFTSGRCCPLPHSIDWGEVASIQDVAQVVDGRWALDADGIRSVEPGYDRLVAIGDTAWRDFEVTVPITIHAFDSRGYRYPSIGPGVGVLLRWQCHQAWVGERSWRGWWPVRTANRWLGLEDWGDQPRWGWWPFGALGWYSWAPRRGFRLNIMGSRGARIADDRSGHRLQPNVCYIFKLRAESRPGSTSWYSLKVWEQDAPEPNAWHLSGEGVPEELDEGSVLLLAHHTAATFGDVRVDGIRIGL